VPILGAHNGYLSIAGSSSQRSKTNAPPATAGSPTLATSKKMKRNIYQESNSIIIDLTYRCNAKCKYCQWGDNATPGRTDLPDDYIYLPEATMKSLETNRIVFSGGEPLLHKNLFEIIDYYKKKMKIKEIILISNGLLLNERKLDKLINHGLTGITFSIDSVNFNTLSFLRGYTFEQIEKILANFNNAVKRNLEIGINCVLSRGNIYGDNIAGLIELANSSKIDFLKFNPIFNDGYVGKNAPDLILTKEDANQISVLKKVVKNAIKVRTNNFSLWDVLSKQLDGHSLDGQSCGLTFSQQIAIRDKLKFCFWIDEPNYGNIKSTLSPAKKLEIQNQFKEKKANCKTGMYCHCLQKMSHKWKVKSLN